MRTTDDVIANEGCGGIGSPSVDIVSWLNSINLDGRFGWRYGSAFAVAGFDAVADLSAWRPDNASLRELLKAAEAPTPHIQQLTSALNDLAHASSTSAAPLDSSLLRNVETQRVAHRGAVGDGSGAAAAVDGLSEMSLDTATPAASNAAAATSTRPASAAPPPRSTSPHTVAGVETQQQQQSTVHGIDTGANLQHVGDNANNQPEPA